jgi:hypothetical protein
MPDETSTLRVTEATKVELRKVGGELTAQDGKERSMEEIVLFLIDSYRGKVRKKP